MKAAFHYIVRAKLVLFKKSNEIDFLEFEDLFEDENPIVARDNAFKHYQNYIDVLLQGKDKAFISDEQAREDLHSFIDSGITYKVNIDNKEYEFSDTFGNGIGVIMVIDNPIYDDKVGDEFFLHGIGCLQSFSYNTDSVVFDLTKELEYYKHFSYNTKDKEIEILYCDGDEWTEGYIGNGEWKEGYFEPRLRKILKTPFDWTGFDKPYWWKKDDKKISVREISTRERIENLIHNGENNQVEFKPALLYNFTTKKGGIGIKSIISRAICAFLNSNGGILLIGVSDDGEIQGLDHDFQLSEGKNPKDFFRLEFDQMLEHFLTFTVKNNINGEFFELKGKEIFVVIVRPSARRPIFLNGQNGKEFYIRGEASSRKLTDVEDIVNYCIDKWGSLNTK